jgi:hypothetical protein
MGSGGSIGVTVSGEGTSVLHQFASVVYVRKCHDLKAMPIKQIEQMFYAEDTLRIEFDPLTPYRHGKVEYAVVLEHANEVGQPDQMAVRVQAITVPTKTEVLKDVKTGYGITKAGMHFREGFHQIQLDEFDIGYSSRQWPYIGDLDPLKRGHMGNKAIDARSNINVTGWVALINTAGN